MADIYDYIVIGSGTSGGIAASRLQQSGARCLLLEAGARHNKTNFPTNEAVYSAGMFWNGGVDMDARATMAFIRARCVGGGSVINQALMDRLDDVALRDWKSESGIDYFTPEGMDANFTRAESGIALQVIPEEQRNRNAKIFQAGHDKHGLSYHPLRRAQCDCACDRGNDCMACLGGCHRDSKQSTLITYIPKGEEAGLEVVSGFNAHRIEHTSDGVTVHGMHNGSKVTYRGAKGIVACGALGTPHLLLRSGFKDKLPALGSHFTAHPQHMCFGIYEEPIDSHKGAFQAFGSDDVKFREWGYKLENVFAPPGAVAMIAPYYGTELLAYMKKYRHFACIETCMRAETFGSMRLGKNERLEIDYNLVDADHKRSEQGVELITDMMNTEGAKKVVRTWMHYCLHLMGGCVAGTDSKTSVVAPDFQVHDHPNLYIADSSTFPNAPGINPALTIAALTHRMADGLTGEAA